MTMRPPILTRVLAALLGAALPLAAAVAGPAQSDAVPMGENRPEQPPARADLSGASEQIRSGDYQEAERILASLQSEFPDDPALLLMRGEVLLALGRPAEAAELLRHGTEIDSQLPRMNFQLGTALASTGRAAEALEAFSRELEVNPDEDVQVLSRLNRSMLLQRGRDWVAAARELEAVLDLQPEREQVYGDLASLYIQAGETEAAMRTLERGEKAGFSSARHYYSLGARLYNSEKLEDAVVMLQQALEVDPGLAEAERTLAAALEKLGREEEARAHLRRYVELRPDAPDASEASRHLKGSEDR
jgi:tetratricopeptide (TPR) repeat protein